MRNDLLNKFTKFLDIFLDKNLNINSKIKKLFKKEEEETIIFDLKDTKEEFDKKIIGIINGDATPVDLATAFCVLLQTKLSVIYKDKTLTLLEKLDETYITQIFDHIVKFDNLVMCEEFLNQTDDKYKTILLSDDKYSTLLKLSVESGAKKITEYFLKKDKFVSLLSDSVISTELLKSCLLLKHIEIANMLLTNDINLSFFKDSNGNIINLENQSNDIFYDKDVVNQIKRKLLYEELKTEFNEEVPKSTSKRMKI